MKKIIAAALAAAVFIPTLASAAAVTYKAYAVDSVITTNKYANTDYVFEIGTEKFTLLDTADGKYLVIANQGYGNKTVKADSFTSTDDASFNYWLNNDFTENGNGSYALNGDILKYIDKNHVWTLDPAPNNPSNPIAEGTTFTAGITISSVSELEAYGDRLGYADLGSNFTTRTIANGTVSGDKYVFVYQSGTSDVSDTTWKLYNRKNPSTAVRPIFYLDDKFFTEVKLDLTKAGMAVKEEIKKLSVTELLKIYTAEELIEHLGIAPPEGYIALDNLTISTKSGENITYGETLIASFDYNSGNANEMASSSVVWERITDGEAVKVGEGDEYIITEADALAGGNALRFKVTVTDTGGYSTEHISSAVDIPALLSKSYAPNYNIAVAKDEENTDYKFTVGDKTFVLIDNFNNDKSTFFVAANDAFGRGTIGSGVFDAEDKTNFAYTLNNTFVSSGNDGNTLPESIIKHIDFEHMWACEAAPNSPNELIKSAYAYKAGVSLLSFTEIEKYKSIIATLSNLGGFSRTASDFVNPSKTDAEYQNVIKWNDAKSAVYANHWELPTATTVQPVFYLGKSFFAEERIDLSKAGAKVIETLKSMYTVEDLSGLYTEAELEGLGFVHDFVIDARVDGLSGGSAASVSGTVTSNTEDASTGSLIFCVYNSDGAMLASRAVKIVLDGKGGTQSFTLTCDTLPEGEYTAKIMFWDNLKTAKAKMKHNSYN